MPDDSGRQPPHADLHSQQQTVLDSIITFGHGDDARHLSTHTDGAALQILRTPDQCFADLPDYPFQPHYIDVASGDGNTILRVHYVDEDLPTRRRYCCCTVSRRGHSFTAR